MEPFEAIDFYDIESLLTEEEIMIRDLVREWVDEEVIPKIEHACEEAFSSMNGELLSVKWVFLEHHSRAMDALDFPMSLTDSSAKNSSAVILDFDRSLPSKVRLQCTLSGTLEVRNKRITTFQR